MSHTVDLLGLIMFHQWVPAGPQVCGHASQPYGFFLTILLIFKCNPLTVTFADDM